MKTRPQAPFFSRRRNRSALTALVVTALLALTAVSVLSDTSEAIPGYTIGGTDDLSGNWYPTLDALMAAETIVSGDMITLLGNITGTTTLKIQGTVTMPIGISINLGGYTLTINTATDYGVYIVHGQIDLRGPGTFNITSSNSIGLYCSTGGSFLSNDDTTVNVKGKEGVIVGGSGAGQPKMAYVTNVTATNGGGVLATDKGMVTVYGNVTATGGSGVSATSDGSNITVDGNVTVTGNYNAVEASIKGDVYVKGNVTATAGTGACVTDSIGEITINGKITAATYIKLNGTVFTAADYNATSYKPGYLEYTEVNAKAWVRMATFTFTDSPAYDIPASTVGTPITNINVAPGVSGGALPYAFSASGLPSWATISSAGVISGTPTAAAEGGTATIIATDGLSHTASITIAYGAVSVAAAPLTFTHSSAYDIPDSTVGTAIANINVAPGVSGGTTPYTFTATGLPSGITISSAGVISGTPDTEASAGTATVTVTDAIGITKSITIAFGAVSETVTEEDSGGGGSNTMVIIAVAVVAILAIGAVLYFFVLKKKP